MRNFKRQPKQGYSLGVVESKPAKINVCVGDSRRDPVMEGLNDGWYRRDPSRH